MVLLPVANAQFLRPIKGSLTGSRWYWASVTAMVGGSTFDAWTSIELNSRASANGLHEDNPLLANSQGQFVLARGIAVKVAVLAAIVGCERAAVYLTRRHDNSPTASRVEGTFSWTNLGFGLEYAGIAAHNASLR